ncbi:hypothetical protein MA16_Dca024286 [Dendrobium catenatum]|uniref:Uncharacterized protein n=1 Tax=Dendrobium catenatum TaxID=906689 RepID=A0A2I0VRP9_9ASPA|nr:hypothetical protein MA16_Dca024286 [Dendrobium catenatum]
MKMHFARVFISLLVFRPHSKLHQYRKSKDTTIVVKLLARLTLLIHKEDVETELRRTHNNEEDDEQYGNEQTSISSTVSHVAHQGPQITKEEEEANLVVLSFLGFFLTPFLCLQVRSIANGMSSGIISVSSWDARCKEFRFAWVARKKENGD